jgi:secreted Zn-dependent insulinase-like peptidase
VVDVLDKDKIAEAAAMLADYKNSVAILRSKSFEGQTDKKDPWYHTDYSTESFSEELKGIMSDPTGKGGIPDGAVGLPPKNTLLPKDLSVLPKSEEDSKEP